jgi:hypothetical protein
LRVGDLVVSQPERLPMTGFFKPAVIAIIVGVLDVTNEQVVEPGGFSRLRYALRIGQRTPAPTDGSG